MVLPGGHDVDEVYVVSLAKLLPAVLAAVFLGMGTAGLFQDLLSGGGSLWIEVAESLDLCALDVGETLHCAGASHAQADEANAHDFHRLDGKSENGFLSLHSGRGLEYDSAVLDIIGDRTGYHRGPNCRSVLLSRRMPSSASTRSLQVRKRCFRVSYQLALVLDFNNFVSSTNISTESCSGRMSSNGDAVSVRV